MGRKIILAGCSAASRCLLGGAPMRYRLILLLLATIASGKLFACSPSIVVPHVLDRAERKVDRNSPAVPEVRVLKVVRGHDGTVQHGDSITIESCAKYGSIQLGFSSPPSDDRTSTDKLGVSWRLVGGTPPAGLREPSGFEQLSPARTISIDWDDGDSDLQESFDFEIVVAVRDLAGNQRASRPLRIADPGTAGSQGQ